MDIDYVILPAVFVVGAVLVIGVCTRRFRSLSARPYKAWRRVGERIVLSLAIVLAVCVAGSSLFNAIALHRFWSSHPPAGKEIVVQQHGMHLDCSGSGSPTLVLDAGLGNSSLIWTDLQPKLAETTQVCSYDRAGFGWSEPRSIRQDADAIASELHQLLTVAGVTGPIVLMGHSIGGLYIRDFAAHYPAQVAGLIFIDSSSPLQDKNPAFVAAAGPGGSGPPAWLLHLAMVAGVPRLIGMCSGGKRDSGYATRKLQAEDICRMHYSSFAMELSDFDLSGEQTLHAGPFGKLPILVFSHDPEKSLSGGHNTAADIARQGAWTDMQEKLKELSTNSRRIVAAGSTHYIPLDRPELLQREVSLFIEQIRKGSSFSPTGITTRE